MKILLYVHFYNMFIINEESENGNKIKEAVIIFLNKS